MAYMQVRMTVKDYSTWKPIFEGRASIRKNGGSLGGQLFRDNSDPNTVTVLLKWDSMENAVKFGQSHFFKDAMIKYGVGAPEVQYMDEVERVQS